MVSASRTPHAWRHKVALRWPGKYHSRHRHLVIEVATWISDTFLFCVVHVERGRRGAIPDSLSIMGRHHQTNMRAFDNFLYSTADLITMLYRAHYGLQLCLIFLIITPTTQCYCCYNM